MSIFKLKVALLGVLATSSIIGCASRPIPRSAQEFSPSKPDVSHLVPTELNFAKELVQFLVNSGWTVQPVRPSKLNGFFTKTQNAAWIDVRLEINTPGRVVEAAVAWFNARAPHITNAYSGPESASLSSTGDSSNEL